MKPSEATVKKWISVCSDDYAHLSAEERWHALRTFSMCDYEELPEDAGVFAWITARDFDCKKKMLVLILYCRPEKRGRYLHYMLRRLVEIAKQEGATQIAIGRSVSGYKEEKFNSMLQRFGFAPCAYSKRIQ